MEYTTQKNKKKKIHRRSNEEDQNKPYMETEDDDINASSKKSKKRKLEHLPYVKEERFTPSKKVKKKNKKKEVEENALLDEQVKSTKKPTKEFNEIVNIPEVQSCTDEHRIPPVNKGKIDGDSWDTKDFFELIRRMELQLPETDKTSFITRLRNLDWNEIQFKNYSIEECKAKWKVLESNIRHYRLLSEVLQDAKTWVESPWSTLNNKRKGKHPEQPTRPLSSFMLFYMDKKNKYTKKYPNLKLTEISRLVGEKFKALPEEKKAYYVEKAKLMQEEYKKNLLKFQEKYPQFMQLPKKRGKSQEKKPLSAFKLYLNDRLQKHENDDNFNRNDFMEKYKELWKTLSTKKKVYWIRLAKEEEDKYLERLEDLQEYGSSPVTAYRTVISKEEQAILDKFAGKPEKPPNSAYSLFSRLMLQNKDDNFVNGEPKNRMKEVANMWKALSIEQKKAYGEELQHLQEIYKLNFANYLESLPEEKRGEELAKVLPKKKPILNKMKNISKAAEVIKANKKVKTKNIEPEKPPVTAWDLYKDEFINKNSHLPSNVAYEKAAATWKTLSAQKIEKYKQKHEQMKEKYLIDFEMFLKGLSEDELNEYYALKGIKGGKNEQNEESAEEESSTEDEENDSAEESESESESASI